MSHYSPRAQVSGFASQVSVQKERFKKGKRKPRITISDDHLTLFYVMHGVQTKHKTHGFQKRNVGLILKGPLYEKSMQMYVLCTCVCVQARIKSHRGKDKDFVPAAKFPTSLLWKHNILILCTNEWPPNVCTITIMKLG